ncbi:DsbA family protein [Chloroflexota bacterium]
MMSNQDNQISKGRASRSERRQLARQKQKRKQTTNTILIVVGAVILVGAMIYPQIKPITDLVIPPARQHPNADFNAMGDPNAPVVVIEYSDFQCSHCRDFWADNEITLIENFVASGDVYFIYRSFGDHDGQAPETGKLAEAAYCAGDQGKFWEMHDIQFANFGQPYSIRRVKAMAKAVGLDMDQFEECFDSGKYTTQMKQDGVEALAAGIGGTPTFSVNGIQVIGNKIEELQFQIGLALQGSP